MINAVLSLIVFWPMPTVSISLTNKEVKNWITVVLRIFVICFILDLKHLKHWFYSKHAVRCCAKNCFRIRFFPFGGLWNLKQNTVEGCHEIVWFIISNIQLLLASMKQRITNLSDRLTKRSIYRLAEVKGEQGLIT